jgi:hypothetical protein
VPSDQCPDHDLAPLHCKYTWHCRTPLYLLGIISHRTEPIAKHNVKITTATTSGKGTSFFHTP